MEMFIYRRIVAKLGLTISCLHVEWFYVWSKRFYRYVLFHLFVTLQKLNRADVLFIAFVDMALNSIQFNFDLVAHASITQPETWHHSYTHLLAGI